jgi:hypothetical protein
MAMTLSEFMKRYPGGRPYSYSDDQDDVTLPMSERLRFHEESKDTWKDYAKNPASFGATPKVANVPSYEQWAASNPQITGDNPPEYQYLHTFYQLPNKSDLMETLGPVVAMGLMGGAMAGYGAGAGGTYSTYGTAGGTFGSGASAALPESYWSMTASAPSSVATDAAAVNAGTVGAGSAPELLSGMDLAADAASLTSGNGAFSGGGGMFDTIGKIFTPSNLLSAGSNLAGALIQSNAAGDAADIQAGATREAVGEQRRQFETSRADMAPWLQTGSASIRKLGDLLGLTGGDATLLRDFTGENLTSEPGYAFRLSEGEKAINRAARARGTSLSPMTVKELLRYGQDFASGEFQNAFNRDLSNRTTKYNMLSGTAGTGQTAANTIATTGANTANNVGNLITGGANARGAAGIAQGNAWGGALSNIGQMVTGNAMLDRILKQQANRPMWGY